MVVNTDRKIKSHYLNVEIVVKILTHKENEEIVIDEVITEYTRSDGIFSNNVNIQGHNSWNYFKKYYKKLNVESY